MESLKSRQVADAVDIENMSVELLELTVRIKVNRQAAVEASVQEPALARVMLPCALQCPPETDCAIEPTSACSKGC